MKRLVGLALSVRCAMADPFTASGTFDSRVGRSRGSVWWLWRDASAVWRPVAGSPLHSGAVADGSRWPGGLSFDDGRDRGGNPDSSDVYAHSGSAYPHDLDRPDGFAVA